MLRMAFMFFHIPFESKLSTVYVKTQNPLAGVFAFHFYVEIRGIELSLLMSI
jgi:hypothetical protein